MSITSRGKRSGPKTAERRSAANCIVALLAAALIACPAAAQDGRAPQTQKPKAPADAAGAEKLADADVSRFCASVAPSIAEARIAWQAKRLAELDAQVKQRIADLEKAEASAREWIAKRETQIKAANDDLVAIYARMQPENAARQLSAMDEKVAAAILSKLKPAAAGAILDEMEAERASRLAAILSGANGEDKKT